MKSGEIGVEYINKYFVYFSIDNFVSCVVYQLGYNHRSSLVTTTRLSNGLESTIEVKVLSDNSLFRVQSVRYSLSSI